MAVLDRETGADTVVNIVAEAEAGRVEALVPFIALMELEYQLRRRYNERAALQSLHSFLGWPVTVHESTPEWRTEAAILKAHGGLSVADAWIAALALLLDAELVHKDPEFDKVRGLQALRLPYDRNQGGQ